MLDRARAEALRLHHPQVRSEHVLLGLLGDRRIAELLVRLGMTRADVRSAVEAQLGDDAAPLRGGGWSGVELRDVLASALEEMVGLGHRRALSCHLLLGLVKLDDSVAGRVLRSFGVGVEGARLEVLEFVAESDRWLG